MSDYGFISEHPIEDLILGERHKVPGRITQYMTLFQLDGIRFQYNNYIKSSNCLLNDDSGLGKLIQSFALLIAICLERKSNKCLVISHNERKFHHWIYYLSILSDVEGKEIRAGESNFNEQIFITKASTIDESIMNQNWNIVVVDATANDTIASDTLLKIGQIKAQCKIFLITQDIIKNLQYLRDIMLILKRPEIEKITIEELLKKDLLSVRNYCRCFLLRRFRKQVEDMLPLMEDGVFESNFDNWRATEVISPVKVTPVVTKKNISRLKRFILSSNSESENSPKHDMKFEARKSPIQIGASDSMSPLVYCSDSEIALPNQIAGEWLDDSNNHQKDEYIDSDNSPATASFNTKYPFTLSNLLKSNDTDNNKSTEIQILSEEMQTPIYVSSSGERKIIAETKHEKQIQESPDLFASCDEDNVISYIESNNYVVDDQEVSGLNSSTPLSEKLHDRSNMSRSSSDLFSDLSFNETILPLKQISPIQKPSPKPEQRTIIPEKSLTETKDNIFEITENNIFPSIIRVNSDVELSLVISESSCDGKINAILPSIALSSKKTEKSPSTPRNKKFTKKRNTPSTSSKLSPSVWMNKSDDNSGKSTSSNKRKNSWFDDREFDDIKRRRGTLKPQEIFPKATKSTLSTITISNSEEEGIVLFSTDEG